MSTVEERTAPVEHEQLGHHEPKPGEHGWTQTGISSEKLGMWVFLGSECLLFGGLISTYLLYKNTAVEGPTPKDLYDIPFTSVSSFVLLMSSMTMVLSLAALQRGDHHRCRAWLVTTALLGATFISGQVYEFTSFVKEGMGYTTNTASSSFYTLTGFHGVHVCIGILMLMSLFLMSLRGRLPQAKSEVLEIIGLYWHFVDVVWIVIFTVVYLIP
ncbi:MAG TPA: heme-copper oxidase subunit III [Acidimicrobiales bacterium]|nr:heme-copper oxidase subunit III [Acidimicrobiales bacterium]